MTRTRAALLLLALAIALPGCVAGSSPTNGQTQPQVLAIPRLVANVDGKGDAQVFLAQLPLTALFKVHGTYRIVAQPIPPYLTVDGEGDLVIEPMPGQEREAQQAVASGQVLVRRAGVAGLLNPPGTAAARAAPAAPEAPAKTPEVLVAPPHSTPPAETAR